MNSIGLCVGSRPWKTFDCLWRRETNTAGYEAEKVGSEKGKPNNQARRI